MFNNYVKVMLRTIIKYKGYSLINIFGLTLGMACTIFILLWVQHELSYDKFHKNSDRLYRVIDYEKYSSGEEVTFSMNPPALAPLLKNEYPEIVEAVRLRSVKKAVVKYNEKRFNEEHIILADPAFFSIFSFPFISGNKENALSDPSSIVITKAMAHKYFGEQNPVGETVRIDNKIDFQITGVIQDIPSNSHLQFEFVIPFNNADKFNFPIEGWNSYAHTIYIQLSEQANAEIISQKISEIIQKQNKGAIVTLSLQSIKDIHLYSKNIWGIGGNGDIRYVYIFSIIAAFILIIACINFINLSTARSANRAKEVGLRKVVGAKRYELISQFLGESIFFSFISMIFSIIIVIQFMPIFNSITAKNLTINFLEGNTILSMIVIITLITGIAAGSYPAIFLSSFQPTRVLKGTLKTGAKNSSFRKILVSIQFILTIFLIIGTLVVNRQLNFIQNEKLGFEAEHVCSINLPGNLREKTDLLKTELLKNTNVTHISAVSHVPTEIKWSTILEEWEGRNPNDNFLIYLLSADYDLTNTLDVEMKQGRYFSREFISDTSNYIVNETAAKMMGMDSPIGKKVLDAQIIGVIKDFHFQSLHTKIAPLLIFYAPDEIQNLLVRVKSKNMIHTIKSLENIWQKTAPEFPFEYSFLNEQIDKMYRTEYRIQTIMNLFTIITLLIACLGLFGLTSFTVQQRTKEVGIRKIIGASIPGIILLLSKDLTKSVLFANVLAWPIAYLALTKWLENYAYRISLSWWMFAISGVIALFIALLTVGWQAIRSAITNPVESLRYE